MKASSWKCSSVSLECWHTDCVFWVSLLLSYVSIPERVSDMTVTTSFYEASASLKLRVQPRKPLRESGLGRKSMVPCSVHDVML